jgi:hypothetical protein
LRPQNNNVIPPNLFTERSCSDIYFYLDFTKVVLSQMKVLVPNGWHYMKQIDMELYETVHNTHLKKIKINKYLCLLLYTNNYDSRKRNIKAKKERKKKKKENVCNVNFKLAGAQKCAGKMILNRYGVSKVALGVSPSRPMLLGFLFRFK